MLEMTTDQMFIFLSPLIESLGQGIMKFLHRDLFSVCDQDIDLFRVPCPCT